MNAIVKLSSLGDIIHSLIVLPKLNEKIDFVVDENFKEILEYNPYINKIIPVRLREAKKNKALIFSIYKNLKKLNYDNVYDLQGLLKSALVSKIIGKNIIGYANPREKIASFFYNKKITSTSNIATLRYLELFEVEDIEYLKNHPKLLFFKDKEFDFLNVNKKNIIFVIGGSWKCKKTPLNIWIELANYLKNENIIVPFYGEEEKKDALFIANNSKNVTIVNLNSNDLKALISKVDLLIGNDTGVSFIAWANNVNNIILYGCTYNNKILENKFSKSVEIQKGVISKKLFNMDKIDIKKIIKIIDEF